MRQDVRDFGFFAARCVQRNAAHVQVKLADSACYRDALAPNHVPAAGHYAPASAYASTTI